MAGKYLRGALIAFTQSFPVPVPRITLFQYNPEMMTHTWTPARAAGSDRPGQSPTDPLAVTGPPEESYSFTLAMDSNDTIEDGSAVTSALAQATGVAPRLAALEMLLFPVPPAAGGLVGTVSSALGLSDIGAASSVPSGRLPVVLFVWGASRIAPVRVSALTFTEKIFDGTLLMPTHVEAQISLKVLSAPDLQYLKSSLGLLGTLANTAGTYTQAARQALALANVANTVESISGMLPF